MHIAIQLGVDKINSFQADMLLPEEIDIELNQAQIKYINTKYGKGNKYQKGFEESQKRIDDIRTLVTEANLVATYKEQLDARIFVDSVTLPDDYMYLVNSRSNLVLNLNCTSFIGTVTNTYGTTRVSAAPGTSTEQRKVNKFVQLDDLYTMLKDPFNTTTDDRPLYTVRGNQLDLYTSDIFIIDKVKITYIRIPAEISLSLAVSCELPDHSHREIVDMAVGSILETIGDPRYKTHEIEVNKNE